MRQRGSASFLAAEERWPPSLRVPTRQGKKTERKRQTVLARRRHLSALSIILWLRWVIDEHEWQALRWFSNHHAKCRDCGCDHVPREHGCTCHIEAGDSECVVHDEPDDDHGIFDELGD